MLRLYNRVGPRRSCNRSTRLSSFMPPGPAFLFDLDGTLVDSVYQHVLAWREALESVGIELSVWRIHRRIGMSGGLFVNALFRETGRDLKPEQAAQIRRVHAQAYARQVQQVRPLPGARELLAYLTKSGSPWAVGTSGRMASAKHPLALLAHPQHPQLVRRSHTPGDEHPGPAVVDHGDRRRELPLPTLPLFSRAHGIAGCGMGMHPCGIGGRHRPAGGDLAHPEMPEHVRPAVGPVVAVELVDFGADRFLGGRELGPQGRCPRERQRDARSQTDTCHT